LDAQQHWESNKLDIRAKFYNKLVIQTSHTLTYESQIESRNSKTKQQKWPFVGTVESKWKDWCSCNPKRI